MKNKVLLSAIGLLMLMLFGCLAPEPPKIIYQGMDFSLLSFQEGKARFNFSIDNPHPLNVNADLDYSIRLNGHPLLSSSKKVKVGAKTKTSFALESNINLPETFGMLQDMLAELKDGKKSIPYEISGMCKATIAGIPVETPLTARGKIPLPVLPEFSVLKVSIATLDSQGASLLIRTNIKNGNKFPLNLDAFQYILRNEGKDLVEGSSSSRINISSGGEKAVDLTVRINFSEFDQKIIDEIKNGTFKPELDDTIKSIH
jgi:hypothetical protein